MTCDGLSRSGSQSVSSLTVPESRTHILFIIDQLLKFGGAERVLFKLIELLPREKFRCSLLTLRDYAPDLQPGFACPVHVLPLTRTYDLRALSAARQLHHLIRSQHVDIVQTFFESSDLWGGLVAKASGCPTLISTRRDMGILRSRKHRAAYRLMRPLVDCVLAVSDHVRDYCIREDGMDPHKVITVYNGLDLENVDRVRDLSAVHRSFCSPSPLVTTVANVRRIKGIEVFLHAAAITRRMYPELRFLVVGEIWDPAYFEELQTLCRCLDLDKNITFLGLVDDVIPYLKASSVFCLLSHSEGFSNALLEAMACSLPCVATRVGGNAEAIVDGQSGFIVSAGDAESTASRLIELIANPARATSMGKLARKRVEQFFTIQIMIEKLVGIYDSCLSQQPNAAHSRASRTRLAADPERRYKLNEDRVSNAR